MPTSTHNHRQINRARLPNRRRHRRYSNGANHSGTHNARQETTSQKRSRQEHAILRKPTLRQKIERMLDSKVHPGIRGEIAEALDEHIAIATRLAGELRNPVVEHDPEADA